VLPKDRELGLFLDSFGEWIPLVGDCEIEDKVIERRAEVEKTLPDEGPPPDQRRLPVLVEDPAALLVFDIVLAGDAVCVGVREPKHATLKILSVHVCSAELLADPLTD
jgi:hypothetical protein